MGKKALWYGLFDGNGYFLLGFSIGRSDMFIFNGQRRYPETEL